MTTDQREADQQKRIVEFGVEFVVELLLFLYPYGAEQMGLPHNFWLGLACWVVGAVIAVRMFWIFPAWAKRLTALEKGLIALICIGIVALVLFNPVMTAYHKRNLEAEKPGPQIEEKKADDQSAKPQPIPNATPPKTESTIKTKPIVALVHPTPLAQPPSTVINAPNGIAIGGGAVTNPTVNNYAPPRRHLSPEFIAEGSKCLSQRTGIVGILAIQGNTEVWKYAQDWYTMFHNAGWRLKDNIINTFLAGGGELPTGTRASILGNWNDVVKQATFDHESPQGQFVACMLGKVFPGDTVAVTPYPDMAKDTVTILIYPQPSN